MFEYLIAFQGHLTKIELRDSIGNVANHVLLRKYFELEIWVSEAEQLFSCLVSVPMATTNNDY